MTQPDSPTVPTAQPDGSLSGSLRWRFITWPGCDEMREVSAFTWVKGQGFSCPVSGPSVNLPKQWLRAWLMNGTASWWYGWGALQAITASSEECEGENCSDFPITSWYRLVALVIRSRGWTTRTRVPTTQPGEAGDHGPGVHRQGPRRAPAATRPRGSCGCVQRGFSFPVDLGSTVCTHE
jgi:hypothetical protein